MKRITSVIKCLLFVLASAIYSTANAQTKHVILISIDGFRPVMYQDKSWPSPNLQNLMKSGVYATKAKSVFPSYTYPSHTAMITGAYPARSGVYYNQPKGSKGEWGWFIKDIKAPTLWQALKNRGMTTAAVEWPVSVTNDITWDVPEIWDVDHSSDRITEARKYATPGLVEEIEANATGVLDRNNMNESRPSLDKNSAKMAAYIFNKYKPALMAVHFALVDGMQHVQGASSDTVRMAMENADECVGIIWDAIQRSPIKDQTTLIIVGDHGFSDIHQVMRPNMLIQGVPAKFTAAGGSCFLYGQKGAEKSVIDSLNKLPADIRKLFRIVEKPELDKMGVDSSALLALTAQPGTVFSGAVAAAPTVDNGPGTNIQQDVHPGLIIPTHGGHHGYDPNIPEMWTGFIAAGAGIKKGGHIDELRLVDIAPLIAKLLNIDFKTPDGHLVEGILKN